MGKSSRRNFMQLAGLGLAGLAASPEVSLAQTGSETWQSGSAKFELGMASYSFREFNLDDTLAMTKRLGLKHIAFKSFHLALDSSQAEIKQAVGKVQAAGLNLYGGGVIYMENEAQVNQAFEYAKAAGMTIIIGVPDHGLLDLVNRKVQEFNIQVAIHNHGPGDERYPSPESVIKRVKDYDRRLGLCMDIGHTQRIGLDPSVEAENYADRLLDVHIKDVDAASEKGKNIEVGRGVIDIPKFLKTLIKIKYGGKVSLEYEIYADDPLPGSAESIGYIRGVLAAL